MLEQQAVVTHLPCCCMTPTLRKVKLSQTCLLFVCCAVCFGSPAPRPNSNFSCGSYSNPQTVCVARCDDGFAGSVNATCKNDGRWSRATGRCVPLGEGGELGGSRPSTAGSDHTGPLVMHTPSVMTESPWHGHVQCNTCLWPALFVALL